MAKTKGQKDGFLHSEIVAKAQKIIADDSRIFAKHGQSGQYPLAAALPTILGKLTPTEIESITAKDVKALKRLKKLKSKTTHQFWGPFYLAGEVANSKYPGAITKIGNGKKFCVAGVANSPQAYAHYEDMVKHFFSLLIGRPVV
jgi:hypothetical protein